MFFCLVQLLCLFFHLVETLYWNPCLTLDEQGRAVITYYTSDNESPHDVVIEGVGRKGRAYRCVRRINQ